MGNPGHVDISRYVREMLRLYLPFQANEEVGLISPKSLEIAGIISLLSPGDGFFGETQTTNGRVILDDWLIICTRQHTT